MLMQILTTVQRMDKSYILKFRKRKARGGRGKVGSIFIRKLTCYLNVGKSF